MDKTDIILYNNFIMHKIISVGKHLTTYNVSVHSHDYWEIVYCTSGNGKFNIQNGFSMEYQTGEIIVIPPSIVHSNVSTEGFTNIHLIMDNISLPNVSFLKIIDNPSQILYHSFSQAYYIYNCDMHDKFNILSILGDLIGNCLTAFVDAKQFSPLVEKIRTEIIKNFTDRNFDLKNIFLEKSNKPEYLRKLFKKETGMTALNFLTETRITYAKKLLRAKLTLNKNITEISQECGFEDALYFSRLFKQRVGCSPLAFSEQPK